MGMDRRTLLQSAAVLGVGGLAASGGRMLQSALHPTLAAAGATGRVVIIGGGMGGTTAAKFLRLWGGPGLTITLVDRNAQYTSNIMSNGILTGQETLSGLRYSYSALKTLYGVTVLTDTAQKILPATKQVTLASGKTLSYDRLVVAPGLSFDLLPGLKAGDYAKVVPHAWEAGAQTTLLRSQLQAMKAGGTFVMTIPPAPYRCPPGPYERACLVADWLTKNKPGSKVVVLDANPKILAEPVNFTKAFTTTHAKVITYVPNAVIDHVDATTKTVYTSAGTFKADVLNPIPPHRAAAIASSAGLVNVSDRWVGVDVLSYESTAVPGIHVLGDAIGTTQPKSGHMANAQAKVAADAIVRSLKGLSPDPAPVTSSACFSPVTMSTASWLTAIYRYDAATKTMVTSAIAEAPAISSRNYRDMSSWFDGLMSDSFA